MYWVKQKYIKKINFMQFFLLFNVAARKFQIASVTHAVSSGRCCSTDT